jgi:metal-responsive CopG/Arc/MetJ family transcriptional regulator
MDNISIKQKWGGVNIEADLLEEVDKVVSRARDHGARKYLSRADFVREAIHNLLDKEAKKGEEIIVRRK